MTGCVTGYRHLSPLLTAGKFLKNAYFGLKHQKMPKKRDEIFAYHAPGTVPNFNKIGKKWAKMAYKMENEGS